MQVVPEDIVGVCWNKELAMNEWLVKWKDMAEEEATWESNYLIQQQFPHLHLEDKVNFEKGGIVRPPIVYT